MANDVTSPALDPTSVPRKTGSSYPAPFDQACAARQRAALGDAVGLSQFGVNLLTLPPGAWSSQRHWHEAEDEFVYVVEGEVLLVTDSGEQRLTPGMVAGFPAGKRDGHHLINRSDRPALVLEVGTRASEETVDYPDIDMKGERTGKTSRFLHRNGEPYR